MIRRTFLILTAAAVLSVVLSHYHQSNQYQASGVEHRYRLNQERPTRKSLL